MTVESTTRRAQYDTNGTAGPWTVPFYFLANADLEVIYTDAAGLETTLTLTTHYSVAGAGVPSGGTVTTVSAYASGGTITVLRSVELLQETDYVETDAFPAAAHETALDRLTMIAQQQDEKIGRAVLLSPADDAAGALPAAIFRLDKMLGFDALTGAPEVSEFTQTQVASTIAAAYSGMGTADAAAFIAAGAGAVSTTVQSKLRESVSAFDFMTAAQIADVQARTELVDVTTALQTAIDYAISVKGRLYMPGGNYRISSTLKIWCTVNGQGMQLIGTGAGAGEQSRATLRWYGNAPAGYVLHLRGCQNTMVSGVNIYFKNLTTYPYLGGVFVETAQPYGGPGSTAVVLEHMNVTGGVGTGSFAVQIGNNNQQVSEVSCTKVIANAGDNGVSYVTEYGFVISGGNNTKDMTFKDCSILRNQVAGVYYTPASSGWNTWLNTGGGDNAIDYLVAGTGILHIVGGGSENSVMFLKQTGGGANHGTVTATGYWAEALSGTNAVEILGCANLELHNCYFSPDIGTTPRYIKFGDALLTDFSTSTFANFISTSNFYKYASGVLPVWNYGLIESTYTASNLAPVHIQSTGDRGCDAVDVVARLTDVVGTPPVKFRTKSRVGSDWAQTRLLPTKMYTPGIQTTCHKITIPYTYLKAAALTTTIGALDVAALGKVVGAYANVTAAFTNGAATMTFSLGLSAGTLTEFLLGATVSGATPALGDADGELGTALARATAVQGGYVSLTAGFTIGAKFTSSAGNLGNGTVTNLTTGSVDIYVLVQDLE